MNKVAKERERIIELLNLWRSTLDAGDSLQLGCLIRLSIRKEPPSQLYYEHGFANCAWLDKDFMERLERMK